MFKIHVKIIALIVLASIILSNQIGTSSVSSITGPSINNLEFRVVTQDDQMVYALQNNEIDIIGDVVDPAFLETLEVSENIEVTHSLRNGYGYLVINTAKYPFNITALRRAFAFAIDKERICERTWDNLAVPLDSPIPKSNPFSCEGKLRDSYYEPDLQHAEFLLNQAGFFDIDNDGFREAPDGSSFTVRIECSQSGGIAINLVPIAAQAFISIGIDAYYEPTDFYEYLNRLYFHQDFDIVFLGKSFNDFDVDWFAKEYCSEAADQPYLNFPNFRNESFDSWAQQLLHGTLYEDVYEAAFKMQEIFVYESPIVICYQNIYLHAHRTDMFEGHVNDVSEGTPGWWTNQEVFRTDLGAERYGGTFRWGLPLYPDTFNVITSTSAYAKPILWELYDPLIRRDTDGTLIDWISASHLIETHEDNPNVPDNHTRFSFDIKKGIQWSDGTSLNANDVAYTFELLRETGYLLTPEFSQDVFSIQAETDFRFVIEFNNESYWYLPEMSRVPILPKSQWSSVNVSRFEPAYNEIMTSGPFYMTDVTGGSTVVLTRNENYTLFKSVSTTDPTSTTPIPMPFTSIMSAAITSCSITIAIGLVAIILQHRRNEKKWF